MNFFRATQSYLLQTCVAMGEVVDCFYSFFEFRGRLHSVHRRFQLTADGRGDSMVIHTEYAGGWNDDIAAERVIGQGSDPRAAVDDCGAYALFCATPGDPNRYYVFDFDADELTPISKISGHPYIGKNWQPFIWEGQLHAVQELTPVRILRFDLAAKQAYVVAEFESGLRLQTPHDQYHAFRGGSNAVKCDWGLLGFGHITQRAWDHLPFQWRLAGNDRIECLIVNWFEDLYKAGYRIVDPCSLFHFAGKFYLSVVASDREWFHTQRFATAIYHLHDDGWVKQLDLSGRVAHGRFPNYATMIATEMPCATARRDELGTRHSRGKPGYLVYGPGWVVDAGGRFWVTMSYTSDAEAASPLGTFDVLITCKDVQNVVAKTDVVAVTSRETLISLDFDIIPAHVGGRFEVRFLSNGTPVRIFGFKLSGPTVREGGMAGQFRTPIPDHGPGGTVG